MLLLGEIHTGLLYNSTAVGPAAAAHALSLVLGRQVRRTTRPVVRATSPDVLTGVDCALPGPGDTATRCVGTTASRATIVGGRVLQGSTRVRVVAGDPSARAPWRWFLGRPGLVDAPVDPNATDVADALAAGFVATDVAAGRLNLGAITARVMDAVQASNEFQGRPPIRVPRTRLRWAAVDTGRPTAGFTVHTGVLRTLRLTVDGADADAITDLCEDIALHDWLLTVVLDLAAQIRPGHRSPQNRFAVLRPAIDHLVHLWMPDARLDRSVVPLWHSLDRRMLLTRQWDRTVTLIRDQIAVSTLDLLDELTSAGRLAGPGEDDGDDAVGEVP